MTTLPPEDREPVNTPEYWAGRIRRCGGDLQRAMYTGTPDEFSRCHAVQSAQVRKADILPTESVLDVGCGYGRLLHVLGPDRPGVYVGVDVSPEFVAMARVLYPGRTFIDADFMSDFWADEFKGNEFDVVVAVWVRTMLLRNGLEGVWDKIHENMRQVARRVVVVQ